jgi:hypothetical protein
LKKKQVKTIFVNLGLLVTLRFRCSLPRAVCPPLATKRSQVKRKSDKAKPLAGEKSGKKEIMRPGDKNYGNNTSQILCNLPAVSVIFSGEGPNQQKTV